MTLSSKIVKDLASILLTLCLATTANALEWTALPRHPETGVFALIAPVKDKGLFVIVVNPTNKTYDFAFVRDDKDGTVYHGKDVVSLIAYDNGAVETDIINFDDEPTLQQLYDFFAYNVDISFFNGKERFDDLNIEKMGVFLEVVKAAGDYKYKAE